MVPGMPYSQTQFDFPKSENARAVQFHKVKGEKKPQRG